ncbi:MAG: ribosome recycling factor, partial [Phycisphaerales bacterium]
LVGQVKKMAEEAKVAIRNERRDANKHVDRLAADKAAGVSEDDAKRAKTRIDDMTKSSTDRVDELATKKIAEIEEV